MNRRGLPGALCALALLLSRPATALTVDALMSDLAQRGDASATFVEEQHLKLLDAPLRSSGELTYRAPGRLEKRTLKPRMETLIYEDGVARIERGKRRMELDLRRVPQILPLVESIRATLAGDRAALERNFALALDEGGTDAWTLRLTPTEAGARALIESIQLRGRGGLVLEVEVRQRNGDWSLTTITPRASDDAAAR